MSARRCQRDADQHSRSDCHGNDVPNQRRSEQIAVRPIFPGERQRVEEAGMSHRGDRHGERRDDKKPLAEAGAGALQRVDQCQSG